MLKMHLKPYKFYYFLAAISTTFCCNFYFFPLQFLLIFHCRFGYLFNAKKYVIHCILRKTGIFQKFSLVEYLAIFAIRSNLNSSNLTFKTDLRALSIFLDKGASIKIFWIGFGKLDVICKI